jgi:hypothetical protein
VESAVHKELMWIVRNIGFGGLGCNQRELTVDMLLPVAGLRWLITVVVTIHDLASY